VRNGPVDYAATGNAGDDEELPLSGKRPTALRRLRGDIAVAIVVLIGAVLLARGLSGGNHTTAGTPTPTPSAAATGFGAPAQITGPPPRGIWTPGKQVSCPAQTDCITTHSLSEPALDALRASFPGATITTATVVRLSVPNFGDALVALDIDAQFGASRVLVRLRGPANIASSAPAPTAGSGSILFGGSRITRYDGALEQYVVEVAVVSPARVEQPLGPLQRLGGDGRLLALS
jgi:hypothetical protein